MINEELLLKCVITAREAGCPKDQTGRLIQAKYIPMPWQWLFHSAAREADKDDGPIDIGVGGARGPGKSHAVLSQAALDDCQRIERLKVLFLRQTAKASKESFDDLIDKVILGHVPFERTNQVLRFPNGSRIILGGFENENDIDKYIGIEYDLIIVEELNQLSEEKYTKLRGSLRTSKPNWRPRMYTSFNPGGLGHQFVKDRYVEPFRAGNQQKTRFIPSTYKENPHLNKEYVDYLEELGGDLGKAWREGDFDLFAGQFFSEWRHDKHVVKPFAIPEHWIKLRSIDPSGRAGITSCHWYALSNDGDVICYREYYRTGKDHDEHAKEIALLSDGENYPYTCIDGAAFAKLGLPETVAEVYERHGVSGLVPSMKNRIMGWNAVHSYLRWEEKDKYGLPVAPKIRFFTTCPHMIRNIPAAIHNEEGKDPQDVKSFFRKIMIEQNGVVVEGNEHQDCLDELRYMLQTLREQKAPKALTVVEKRIAEIKMKEHQESFNYRYSRRTN